MEEVSFFEIVKHLLKGVKNNNRLVEDFNGERIILNDCKYLLNQTIRQYSISNNHIFVSEKAFALWDKISDKNISCFSYRDKVVMSKEGLVEVDKYKGRDKTPYQKSVVLRKGDSFIFNDIFSDEHIITVSNIIKELYELKTYDYENLKGVFDKIYVCKMLKEEDYLIQNISNRFTTDYREVIFNDYANVGIRIHNFDYKTALEDMIYVYKEELKKMKENS